MMYMNVSGDSIIEVVNFYKIKFEKFIVIYDDIVFDVGVVKMRKKGFDGGYNGVKLIIQCLGIEEFFRIRIGIGVLKYDMVKYVLFEFEDGEKEKIFKVIEKAVNGIKILFESDIDRVMNYINGDVVVQVLLKVLERFDGFKIFEEIVVKKSFFVVVIGVGEMGKVFVVKFLCEKFNKKVLFIII